MLHRKSRCARELFGGKPRQNLALSESGLAQLERTSRIPPQESQALGTKSKVIALFYRNRHDEGHADSRAELPPPGADHQANQQGLLQGNRLGVHGISYQARWIHHQLGQSQDLCCAEKPQGVQRMFSSHSDVEWMLGLKNAVVGQLANGSLNSFHPSSP